VLTAFPSSKPFAPGAISVLAGAAASPRGEALALRMAYGKAAPEVLRRKAGEANRHSGKKSTQAVAGGTIMGSATIAHAFHSGMSGTTEIRILIVVAVLAGIFFFNAWRHSQRATAFVTEAKR
jgi:hypothetical protein